MENVRAHASEQLPESLRGFHPRRSGHITVITEPPYSFSRRSLASKLLAGRKVSWGVHGYAPDHPDMAAIFYAMGRGIPAGARIDRVRAIDIAPTVSRLLGIDPPRHSEGRVQPILPIPRFPPGRGPQEALRGRCSGCRR